MYLDSLHINDISIGAYDLLVKNKSKYLKRIKLVNSQYIHWGDLAYGESVFDIDNRPKFSKNDNFNYEKICFDKTMQNFYVPGSFEVASDSFFASLKKCNNDQSAYSMACNALFCSFDLK